MVWIIKTRVWNFHVVRTKDLARTLKKLFLAAKSCHQLHGTTIEKRNNDTIYEIEVSDAPAKCFTSVTGKRKCLLPIYYSAFGLVRTYENHDKEFLEAIEKTWDHTDRICWRTAYAITSVLGEDDLRSKDLYWAEITQQ